MSVSTATANTAPLLSPREHAFLCRLATRGDRIYSRKGVELGQHKLAHENGCSARTVRRTTRGLARRGVLVKIPHKRQLQPDGTWRSVGFNRYRLARAAANRLIQRAVDTLTEPLDRARRAQSEGLSRSHREAIHDRSSPSGSGAGRSDPATPPQTRPPDPPNDQGLAPPDGGPSPETARRGAALCRAVLAGRTGR